MVYQGFTFNFLQKTPSGRKWIHEMVVGCGCFLYFDLACLSPYELFVLHSTLEALVI